MKKTLSESAPLVRPIKRLFKGQSIDPSDFAGPIPGLLDIRSLEREVDELQEEYDRALADRDFKEKEVNDFEAAYREAYAEYEALGCEE